MSERILTDKITRYLKRLKQSGVPVFWLKIHGGSMQKAGVPDLLVVVDGRFLFVEIKTPSGRLSRIQEVRIAEIAQAGGPTCVVRSVDEFESAVKQLASLA